MASLLALGLGACGGGVVRGQPPLVGISTLTITQEEFRARVDIHNPNGVDMRVNRFDMSMTLGETDLGRHTARPGININPNGVEEIRFVFPANDAARQTLARLEGGELSGVPYTVSGELSDGEGESGKFRQQGYFYPVPGRPGQFRGAGAQLEPHNGPGRERREP